MPGSLKLLDPERCRGCGTKGKVIDSRAVTFYRWRRHECRACDIRWTSYQMLVNPRRLRVRAVRPDDHSK